MNQLAAITPDTVLYLDGVTVSFDGFKALNNLSLIVDARELRCIIGPNGAGKTTMMDVITGRTRPDSGLVRFQGDVDLTRLSEAEVANLGIGRKFQRPTVFPNLTVFENLEIALSGRRRVFENLVARPSRDEQESIQALLETIGLAELRNGLAGTLSHGQKQWLEIGILLAQDPKLILLDEPVAGMTGQETERTAELLNALSSRHCVVVVEHDMHFVRSIAQKVTVLHEGTVLAEGNIDEVSNNDRVAAVYLGTD